MQEIPLHEALLSASTYRAETGPVTFLETHISRLYLTKNHVYKVKKPVNLGFLDFTTLAQRRHFCQEEVRLNRRFAPGIYQGVVTIRRQGDRICLDGSGEIIDYAVLMRRLPEERLLHLLIASDDPDLANLMEPLARRIALLHQNSAICRNENGQPSLQTVRDNWEENLQQCRSLPPELLLPAAREQMGDYVRRFLHDQAELLRQREEQGFVRDCHGDLHAGNICLTDPIVIYDCIEFNRRFRIGDIAADLAFLLMDLEFRGRRDLATRVLESYQSAMGHDRDLPRLLPFYKIYRAWVRGKVEALLAIDVGAATEVRQRAAGAARRYFNLALGYLCPPQLLLTCGLMGCGKTTLAHALSRALHARHLRSDELRKELAGLAATEAQPVPFGQGIYTETQTRRTYATLLQHALTALAAGQSVIVDASFIRRQDRQKFHGAAVRAGLSCRTLWLDCEAAVALRRLDQRQARAQDASDGRRELYRHQARHFSPPDEKSTIRVDSARNVDYNVQLILSQLIAP